jgi:lipopolysaccharide/colanic/teichoic acid biosynthesis glycosyltransferase
MIYWVNQYAITPDSPGGTRHFEFSRFLTESGEDVTILASDLNLSTRQYRRRAANDRTPIVESVDGVRFEWLYASSYEVNDWRRGFSMLWFAWSVLQQLLRVRVNDKTVFIGSSPHLFAALATQLAAWWRGVPFVLEVRDLWPETLIDMTGKGGVQARVLRLIANHLYRTARAIIVLARSSKDHIGTLGFDTNKIAYIPNGIDPRAFDLNEPQPSPIPLPQAKMVFVYAGAHGPANDLETLLRAAAELQRRNENSIHILLVGDGPSKNDLLRLAQELRLENTALHDPIQKHAIPALLSNTDAGILTLQDAPVFRFGISPNKLFDYMAAGLPVVTNVAGEVTTIVQTAQCGVSVSANDPVALADGMIALKKQLEQQPNLGAGGRKYVEEHHNRSRLVTTLQSVIHQFRGKRNADKAPLVNRTLDVLISVIGLIVTAPITLLIALLIRLEDGGPVFFAQERVGKDGLRFRALKFRSMIQNAELQGLGLAVAANDDRITRIGKFIRATSIDELPQLWNVLRGEMSIVGPRPTVQNQVDRYTDFQRRRLEVKPGLTGWAQVNGRNSIPWEKRIELDVWYVDHRSLWLDALIVLRTPLALIPRANTHYGPGGVVEDFKGSDQ